MERHRRKLWFQWLIISVMALTIWLFPMGSAHSLDKNEKWSTPDEYWVEICKIARKAYTGMDVELVLDTGYTHYLDKGTEYPGNAVSMGVSVPLYSKKERMRRREDVIKFRQKGAQLIRKLETAIAQVKIFKEAGKFLYAKIDEEGVDAVTAYFDQLNKMAEQEAMIIQYHREIQSLINPFSGKAQILNNPAAVIPVSVTDLDKN